MATISSTTSVGINPQPTIINSSGVALKVAVITAIGVGSLALLTGAYYGITALVVGGLALLTGVYYGSLYFRSTEKFFAAVEEGACWKVKLFIAAGMDVNRVDGRGKTALMLAASKGHTETVQALLAVEGVEVNQRDNDGYTALMHAASEVYTETFQVLLAFEGVEVNQRNNNGYTVLMSAASSGYTGMVQALLAFEGVEVNQRGNNGYTALMYAASNGHAEVVRSLLGTEGVEVNQRDNDGYTALMGAAANGHAEIVRVLLGTEGVDVNLYYAGGNTVMFVVRTLRHADFLGYREIAELLEIVESLLSRDREVQNLESLYGDLKLSLDNKLFIAKDVLRDILLKVPKSNEEGVSREDLILRGAHLDNEESVASFHRLYNRRMIFEGAINKIGEKPIAEKKISLPSNVMQNISSFL